MGNEFGGLNALKIMNCDEKRRKWCSGLKPHRWIKTPPLDARSVTPPEVLNDVLRVLKRQNQL